MFYFITGKPGNGKTLLAIAIVHALQKSSGRAVYYFGVPLTDLGKEQLGWIELQDAQRWYDCPDGSIVLIDEVQQHWRVRMRGAEVPEAVRRVETHRHKGFDLFYLSQDPLLVDTNLRKLVWEHTHVKRSFGLERATLYKWKQRVASPDSKNEYKDAISESWSYPKQYYGYYNSAELHTAEKQLPWKKFGIIGAVAVGFVIAMFFVFTGWGKHDSKLDDVRGSALQANGQEPLPIHQVKLGSNPWEASRWIERVAGHPDSAPAYDRLQVVRSAPKVAGCSSYVHETGLIECTCTTYQNTVIDIPVHQCVQIMKKGLFDATRAYVDIKAANVSYLNSLRSSQPVANLQSNPSPNLADSSDSESLSASHDLSK